MLDLCCLTNSLNDELINKLMSLNEISFSINIIELQKCRERLTASAASWHIRPLLLRQKVYHCAASALYHNETDYEHQPCSLWLIYRRVFLFLSPPRSPVCLCLCRKSSSMRQIPALWVLIHPQAARLAASSGAQLAYLKPQCTIQSVAMKW